MDVDDEDVEEVEEQLEDFAGLLPDGDALNGDMAENENEALISAMETAQFKHQQKLCVASNLVCNFSYRAYYRRCIFDCSVILCLPPSLLCQPDFYPRDLVDRRETASISQYTARLLSSPSTAVAAQGSSSPKHDTPFAVPQDVRFSRACRVENKCVSSVVAYTFLCLFVCLFV